MINRVILTGRLTRDVELRRTNDGTPFTFFTVAVNRRNGDNTDFISCVAWRQTAELMQQYLNKGALIGIEGRLEVFTQQNNGEYVTRTNVQVTNITFLERKSDSASTEKSNTNNSANEQSMTFAGETNIDQTQTTPVNNSGDVEFGKAEEVNANDINLEEIKF